MNKNTERSTHFTALGMSGSGKTCYVIGMYYQMITGYKGFSLKAGENSLATLEAWMDKLDDGEGMDRFPAGTALTEVNNYEFTLKYALKDIMTFNWIDYGGGTLVARDSNPEAYEQLNNSIESSTTLYIFIDGGLLCHDDIEDSINAVTKSARRINSFLQEFSDNHQDDMPPIVFVITKSDLCSEYLEGNRIEDIMRKCFNLVMTKGVRCYITSVSLGKNISDDNYRGDVAPLHIHIPFFIGIYHQFLAFCCATKAKKIQAQEWERSQIAESREQINREKNRTGIGFLDRWLCNPDRVDSCVNQIAESQENIENYEKIMEKYKKLMVEVASQLLKDSKDFIMYEDGIEKDFQMDDEILNL